MNIADIIKDKQTSLLLNKSDTIKPLSLPSKFPRYNDYFREDRVFIMYRSREHLFMKYNGFGLSAAFLLKLVKRNCSEVRVIYNDGETERVYIATPQHFLDKGVIHLDGNNDYQRILSLEQFRGLE